MYSIIGMWAQVYFILSQSRLTDRRTDRQTEIKAPAIPFVAMHIYMLSHGKNLTILTTESSYTSAYTLCPKKTSTFLFCQ